MDNGDILKKLIIAAINSSPSTRKKILVLKSRRLGDILQCYKEAVDKFCPGRDESEKYERENFLLKDIVSSPQKAKAALTTWAKSEAWQIIVEKTGKHPDEYEFEIKFQQILDEI